MGHRQRRARRRMLALVVAMAMAGSLPGASAGAAETRTVTTRNFAYEPTPTSIEVGDSLVLTNADPAPHDLTARQTGDDGQPLFASATIAQNETAPVEGVEDLPAGSYPFYCTIHPQMAGVLTVGAALPDTGGSPSPGLATVPTPTSITAHDGSLYVASFATGTVYELPILAGGVPGPAEPYITGLSSPLGVVLDGDGTTYVSDSHPAVTEGRSTAGRVWAVPPGGGDVTEVGEVVVDELPNGRHNTNGLAIHEGRLYITNGNSTDDGVEGGEPEEPLSGTLLSVPIGARNVVVGTPSESEIRVDAVGMRNIYDVAFRPGTSEAWLPMNGLDMQDPWGEDLLLRADVGATEEVTRPGRGLGRGRGRGGPPSSETTSEPEDFGFPGCVYAAGFEPSYRQNLNPDVTDVCDGTQKLPEQLMGLHTSADGLAFGPDDEFWDGDLFVALFGNFFGDEVVGHRVVRVPIADDGTSSPPEDFIVTPAPLDVTFVGSDLYIADFSLGVLLVKPGL